MYYNSVADAKARPIIFEDGKERVNPNVRIMRQTLEAALKIGAQYGLTLSSRERISAPPQEEINGKFSAI
jgi:phage terminase small subunit